jgi:hypothetical protein
VYFQPTRAVPFRSQPADGRHKEAGYKTMPPALPRRNKWTVVDVDVDVDDPRWFAEVNSVAIDT